MLAVKLRFGGVDDGRDRRRQLGSGRLRRLLLRLRGRRRAVGLGRGGLLALLELPAQAGAEAGLGLDLAGFLGGLLARSHVRGAP